MNTSQEPKLSNRLIILSRHSIAEDQTPGLPDIRRQLTVDGEKVANHAGGWLKRFLQNNKLPFPDLIIYSPSVRTTQTANIFLKTLDLNTDKLVSCEDLYRASDITTLAVSLDEIVGSIDPTPNALMLVGHNPLISFLATELIGKEVNLRPSDILLVNPNEDLSSSEMKKRSILTERGELITHHHS